mmetsp:Transcript_5344/g.14476  ORF Transcript_5344/g.14476 Transcript_5344/m.14476 type:complete len:196 (+) Transcript_5344:83-670(+)
MAARATAAERSAASAAVGSGLAAGLCESVGNAAEKAQASPHEDVRGYLQQTLLPILGPAVEQLLHHIHESGELQRALREKAEAERAARRLEARRNTSAEKEAAAIAGAAGAPAEAPPQDAAAADAQSEADGPEPFDPLAWLSERLRESAAGPTSQYTEQIQQRVRQQIAAAEAALLEEAEEEEGGAAAKPVGSES